LRVVGVPVLSLLGGALAHRVSGAAARAVLPFALLIAVGTLTLAWWRASSRSARWRRVLEAFAERELAAAGQGAAVSADALSETRAGRPARGGAVSPARSPCGGPAWKKSPAG
jgi:hypothetical protein